MTSPLEHAEATLRNAGPSPIPAGLAERAIRAAFAARPAEPRFFDHLFHIGWRVAMVAVTVALVLALVAERRLAEQSTTVADPITALTSLTDDTDDAVPELLGVP